MCKKTSIFKKIKVILLIFFMLPVINLSAQQSGSEYVSAMDLFDRDEVLGFAERAGDHIPATDLFDVDAEIAEADIEEEPAERPDPHAHLPRIFRDSGRWERYFDFKILNINNIGFSNNFIYTRDYIKGPIGTLIGVFSDWTKIFNEDNVKIYEDLDGTINIETELNLNRFLNGFKMDLGANITALALFIDTQKWGFGLDIGSIEVIGNLLISNKLLSLDDGNAVFGLGAAAFVDVGFPFYLKMGFLDIPVLKNFKFSIRPAAFVPALYVKPGITYSRKDSVNSVTGAEGELISIDYNIKVYSPFAFLMEDEGGSIDASKILKSIGVDLGFGAEYPLFTFLDLGVNIVNFPVPFLGARVNDYIYFHGNMFLDTSYIDVGDLINGNDFPENAFGYPDDIADMQTVYGSSGEIIRRPFKMLFYVNYRPFDAKFLTLNGIVGFSVSKLYPNPMGFEFGTTAFFDIKNISIVAMGINYTDRKWINSLNYSLNMRIFQFDIGYSMQSPNFVGSWRGAGYAFNLGLRFGW